MEHCQVIKHRSRRRCCRLRHTVRHLPDEPMMLEVFRRQHLKQGGVEAVLLIIGGALNWIEPFVAAIVIVAVPIRDGTE